MANGAVKTSVTVEGGAGTEDVSGVRARISWGAVLAGSVLAIALYFLLTLLGGAIGFSVSDKFGGRTIGIAAAVYAIVIIALSCSSAGSWRVN